MGYISELRKVVGTKPLLLVGACVLVFNEAGHLLLQKRADTLDWGTIGGAMELGESMEEAAHRELYEETGLRAGGMKFVTLLSGSDMYFQYPHGDEVYNVIAVYEALDVTGTPVVNDLEGLEVKYFALDEPIPELNPFNEKYLRKAGYIQKW
ncbi:ADP-ribose pyrophosphatase [Paenibacillus sp. E194]|uniref:NUDIX hydrolase n=1 Tax=Paenibacillus sp. E194 TaxID=1458845 RepID=UPI0005C8E28C|nr:NUDIX hydrolase [Paenibacillus sp. E194]KJB86107.1 ADP-ribose pyrophosphatase [Paenibacillus sp. E194]